MAGVSDPKLESVCKTGSRAFLWGKANVSVLLLAVGALPASVAISCSDTDEPPPQIAVGGGGAGGAEPQGGGGEVATGGSPTGDPYALPVLLSQTGLYKSDMSTLGEGVRPYRPRFALWTDGAEKKRWVRFPAGAVIDVADVDFWQYPEGISFFKEFVRDGVRVETRILQKQENGTWRMGAYQWRSDQSEADLVLDGVPNASGTEHDIPSEMQCFRCHNQMPDRVIGFSALQLSHDVGGLGGASGASDLEVNLASLVLEDKLSAPIDDLVVPGDTVAQEALGYLHANCGHCHQAGGSAYGRTGLSLWLLQDSLSSVEATSTYTTSVDVDVSLPFDGPQAASLRIAPGSPETSAVFLRLHDVDQPYVMPPLGTEMQNTEALDNLGAFINSL